jgi:hypothetical protein
VTVWGTLAVRGLEPIAVQTLRDAMKEAPLMANQMLSVGGTIWDWAIPLNLAKLRSEARASAFWDSTSATSAVYAE